MNESPLRETKTGIKNQEKNIILDPKGIQALFKIVEKGEAKRLENTAKANSSKITSAYFNARNKKNQTLLNLAVLNWDTECVRILLTYGANPLKRGKDLITGWISTITPLHLAYEKRTSANKTTTYHLHTEIATLLLEALPSNPFTDDTTDKAREYRTELLKAKGKNNNTLLHLAIKTHSPFAALLPSYGVNEHINVQETESGNTPLHLAMQQGDLHCSLAILAAKGDRFNLRNHAGFTARELFSEHLYVSLSSQNFETLDKANQKRFCDLDDLLSAFENKENIFSIAIERGWPDLITTLSAHANVNVANKYGDTPLHYAIKMGSLECILAILATDDADLDMRNLDNRTALELLEESKKISDTDKEKIKNALGRRLLENGANPVSSPAPIFSPIFGRILGSVAMETGLSTDSFDVEDKQGNIKSTLPRYVSVDFSESEPPTPLEQNREFIPSLAGAFGTMVTETGTSNPSFETLPQPSDDITPEKDKKKDVTLHPLAKSHGVNFEHPLGTSALPHSSTTSSDTLSQQEVIVHHLPQPVLVPHVPDMRLLQKEKTEIRALAEGNIRSGVFDPADLVDLPDLVGPPDEDEAPTEKPADTKEIKKGHSPAASEDSTVSFATTASGSSAGSTKSTAEKAKQPQALSIQSSEKTGSWFRWHFGNKPKIKPEPVQKPEDDSVKPSGCCGLF